MCARSFEVALARLYSDEAFLTSFLEEPERALGGFALTAEERASLLRVDRTGLRMAARSFARKREKWRRKRRGPASWLPWGRA